MIVKKRIGRPPSNEPPARNIKVRLTDAEWDAINAMRGTLRLDLLEIMSRLARHAINLPDSKRRALLVPEDGRPS